MGCELCGGGDRWIKTRLAPDGSRLRVCDPCWEDRKSDLLIVPADQVVTARSARCGAYGNPRDFPQMRPGGRHGAFSGTCGACTEGDAKDVGGVPYRTNTSTKESIR